MSVSIGEVGVNDRGSEAAFRSKQKRTYGAGVCATEKLAWNFFELRCRNTSFREDLELGEGVV